MRAIVVCLGILLSGLAHAAEPNRENLIAAWEQQQRADPEVTTLEATGDRRYRFATSRFDYDGPLEITDVVVDHLGGMDDTVMGLVQVSLPAFSDEDMERRAYSYSLWARGNTLHWSSDEARWLSADEWSAQWQQDYSSYGLQALIGSPLIILGLFIAFLLWTSFQSRRQMKEAMTGHREAMKLQQQSIDFMERAMRMQEESNTLLRQIRDAINKP